MISITYDQKSNQSTLSIALRSTTKKTDIGRGTHRTTLMRIRGLVRMLHKTITSKRRRSNARTTGQELEQQLSFLRKRGEIE